MIPGSRGDFSYLVAPVPSPASLFAGAWAGRKWMRSECRPAVQALQPAQLAKTRLGSHVICEDKQLIYEEAPEAYKPVDSIIASLEQAGLLTVLAKLRPVLTYKTRELDPGRRLCLAVARRWRDCRAKRRHARSMWT